ncbi:MAG: hypothetical protein OEY94_10295 [Alphaproteobacteria bacterium]|nr:hypothetical protein [Alphaproteobacteria bacterium]
MKKILFIFVLATLPACTTTTPEQIENMSTNEREEVFNFENRSTQELCKAYTNPNIPIGPKTHNQIVQTLKNRGKHECFDKSNNLVKVEEI